jgi:phage replication-related protein YjqB (UPF0714/DUF867 family)
VRSSKDPYHCFADLARAEPGNFSVYTQVRNGGILITAPHGGGLEPGTSELARAIAGDQYSLYVFESNLEDGNQRLHLTSTRFDEPIFDQMASVSQVVVSLHGCEGEEPAVHVGGLDIMLGRAIITCLRQAGFSAHLDNSHPAGQNPANLCNRGTSRKGVQLELETGLRRGFFVDLKRSGREHPTPLFFQFTSTVQQALAQEVNP